MIYGKWNFILDEHGHRILNHDLSEVTDEFIKFAKNEKLSFWV
jgi:hypothetical protein